MRRGCCGPAYNVRRSAVPGDGHSPGRKDGRAASAGFFKSQSHFPAMARRSRRATPKIRLIGTTCSGSRCNDFDPRHQALPSTSAAGRPAIDLDAVRKKYDAVWTARAAISESQERMAVVVAPEDDLHRRRRIGKSGSLPGGRGHGRSPDGHGVERHGHRRPEP